VWIGCNAIASTAPETERRLGISRQDGLAHEEKYQQASAWFPGYSGTSHIFDAFDRCESDARVL
jgi:hypothetical protein